MGHIRSIPNLPIPYIWNVSEANQSTLLMDRSITRNRDWHENMKRIYINISVRMCSVFFKFYFELMKCCQHFGKTFGKFWESFATPPGGPPPKREKLYILHCAKLTFCRTFDNNIGYFEFCGLKLF